MHFCKYFALPFFARMQVNLRRGYRAVSEKFLYVAQLYAFLKQKRSKRMAKCMRCNVAFNSCRFAIFSHEIAHSLA